MPILKEGELDIFSHSVEQTRRLGNRLGKLLRPGDIICLSGDMGAGKTVFSAGIGEGWGAKTPLTSPTFNLVHQHQRDADSQKLYHLDCYRLYGTADADSIGLDDILEGNGPVILEWAERIEDALPEHKLWIDIRVLEFTRRNFFFEGIGARPQAIIDAFRTVTFGIT